MEDLIQKVLNSESSDIGLGVDFRVDNSVLKEVKESMVTEYGSKFGFAPHITLVLMAYSEENYDKYVVDFERLVKKLTQKRFMLSQVECDIDKAFFYLNIEEDSLKELHIQFSDLANEYRGGLIRSKDMKRLAEDPNRYSMQDLKMLIKYGFNMSGDGYKPHITIGNIADPAGIDLSKVQRDLNKKLQKFIEDGVLMDSLHVVLHTITEKQSEMKVIREKIYNLS